MCLVQSINQLIKHPAVQSFSHLVKKNTKIKIRVLRVVSWQRIRICVYAEIEFFVCFMKKNTKTN